MSNQTVVVYIFGKPGTGKYTTAKELERQAGFLVCDNQLINNPIFALLGYDGFGTVSEEAWSIIARIRNAVFDFMIQEKSRSYVLTNVLYQTEGDAKLYEQVKEMARSRGSLFLPVKLTVSYQENCRRIQDPERRLRFKSVNVLDICPEEHLLEVTDDNLLEIDVTNLSAENAVKQVLKVVEEKMH